MNTKHYGDELAAIQKRFDDDTTALAEKVRREVVVPACRRHRLTFRSCNGAFGFRRNGSPLIDSTDSDAFNLLPGPSKAAVVGILDLLRRSVSHGQWLGDFIRDVNGDYK